MLGSKYDRYVDLLFNIGIVFFLFFYFKPQLLFLSTTTCGGDTGSHVYTLYYLKEYLIPSNKILGWCPSNYAGFPLFYHYFPLPFLLMVLLSYITSPDVAFKLVTFLSVALFPIGVFILLSALEYQRPIPHLGTLFSLAYLFNEKQTMWGGNIPSMLAGEFAFSLSLFFFLVLVGYLYRGIREGKYLLTNSLLFALMIFSHGYTSFLLFFASSFFLFSKKWKSNLWYLFKVYFIGSSLVALWLLPFLANLPWTTPFRFKWHFANIWEVFPPILIPFFILSLLSYLFTIKFKTTQYLLYFVLLSLFFYLIAFHINLCDIRFLTFTQLFLTFPSAIIIYKVYEKLDRLYLKSIFLFVVAALSIFWIFKNVTYIRDWINWNYEGFERKQPWSEVSMLFDYLRYQKREGDTGRIFYEHSLTYEKYGTILIFHLLPHFAERATLEGLYFQSSITSPFIFYLQAELSKDISAPLIDYPVGPRNIDLAIKHLNLFNVSKLIIVSNEIKNLINNRTEFTLEKVFGDLHLYSFQNKEPGYVIPAKYEPVLYLRSDWKKAFYRWFQLNDTIDVPIVYSKDKADRERFKYSVLEVQNAHKVLLNLPSNYTIQEKISNEKIEFTTTLIGYPHIIRVSYHPNWKVKGAKKIYLVAPSFMLVFPEERKVTLTFEKSIVNRVGELLTFISWFYLIGITIISSRTKSSRTKNRKSFL